jgi:hypothetical protein
MAQQNRRWSTRILRTGVHALFFILRFTGVKFDRAKHFTCMDADIHQLNGYYNRYNYVITVSWSALHVTVPPRCLANISPRAPPLRLTDECCCTLYRRVLLHPYRRVLLHPVPAIELWVRQAAPLPHRAVAYHSLQEFQPFSLNTNALNWTERYMAWTLRSS